MGSLKKDMRKYFETEDLYELLMVGKDATDDQIKRAYRKLSLRIHPDRVSGSEKDLATIKFQVLGKVHSVLSDQKKRKIYDETGIADDDLVSDKISDWSKYFDSIFKKVDLADIEALEKEYIGSDEEKEDLKKLYLRFKGKMNVIMEYLMFYQFEHEDRYRAIIQALIDNKEVPDYKIFTEEPAASIAARQKKCENEAKAAAKFAAKSKKNGKSDDNDLVKMIQQRQQQRGDLADQIANRHGVKIPAKSDGSDDDWEGLSGDDVGKSELEDDEDEGDDDEKPIAPPVRSSKKGKKHPAPKNANVPAAKRRRN